MFMLEVHFNFMPGIVDDSSPIGFVCSCFVRAAKNHILLFSPLSFIWQALSSSEKKLWHEPWNWAQVSCTVHLHSSCCSYQCQCLAVAAEFNCKATSNINVEVKHKRIVWRWMVVLDRGIQSNDYNKDGQEDIVGIDYQPQLWLSKFLDCCIKVIRASSSSSGLKWKCYIVFSLQNRCVR